MSEFWIGFLLGMGIMVIVLLVGNIMAVKKGYLAKSTAGKSLKDFVDNIQSKDQTHKTVDVEKSDASE